MCEYCGCQEIAAIGELTREHDEIRELIRIAKQASFRGDSAAAQVVAGQLIRALRPHATVEEDGLFGVMAAEFGEHVAELIDEHRRIDSVITEIAAGPPLYPNWVARFDTALQELCDHILKEQDGLFPAALATLSTTDWEIVDAARQAVAASQPDGMQNHLSATHGGSKS